MNATLLVGRKLADVLTEDTLRGELKYMYPSLTDDIDAASGEALRTIGRQLTGGAVVTAASYSKKRRKVQLATNGDAGPRTFHVNERFVVSP